MFFCLFCIGLQQDQSLLFFISSIFHVHFFVLFTHYKISLFSYIIRRRRIRIFFPRYLHSSQFHFLHLPSGNKQLFGTSANLIEYAHKAIPHAFLPRAILKNPPSPHPEFQLHTKWSGKKLRIDHFEIQTINTSI